MNKTLLVIITFSLLSSCNQKGNSRRPDNIVFLNGLRLTPSVDSLFKQYAKETPNAISYAIFIDQKTEGEEYTITFAPFVKKNNSIYENGATVYFMYNDTIPVFVYTGLEDFVVCDSPLFAKSKEVNLEAQQGKEFKHLYTYRQAIDFSKEWSYVHLSDTAYIVKGYGEPFSKITLRPAIRFNPPDSANSKH